MEANGCTTHCVFKISDAEEALTDADLLILSHMLNKIAKYRKKTGRAEVAKYYIVNKDESWAQEVKEVIDKHVTCNELDWDKALEYLNELITAYEALGPAGTFALMFLNEYKERYTAGERTETLYEQIVRSK